MTSGEGTSQAPRTPSEIADLKRLAAGIIRTQGNRFIKELLRAKRIRIGVNKDDFERNLTDAIESGELRLDEVEDWLAAVEGWGNQHVYLYNISSALQVALTEDKIHDRVRAAGLEGVWGGATVLEFPDEPKLTSISFTDSVLSARVAGVISWVDTSPRKELQKARRARHLRVPSVPNGRTTGDQPVRSPP
jgi:hypothetical protein